MAKILCVLNQKYSAQSDPNPNNSGDQAYVRRFQGMLQGHKAAMYFGKIETIGQLDIFCKRAGVDAIATNRTDVLSLLLGEKKELKSVDNYVGSIFHTTEGREVLILPVLRRLVTQSYGEWLVSRHLSKILAPHTWRKPTEFRYKVLQSPRDFQEFHSLFSVSWLVSIDIETLPPNIIRSVSYTLGLVNGESFTGCFKVDSVEKVEWMEKYNSSSLPKLCQNGKYEAAHFFSYRAPMINWIADTLNAMHCTWSELPKDLNFASAIFNREHRYWKDVGNEGGWENLLHYNALDTWQTFEAFCSWLESAPKYALDNYIQKFPQNYIAHLMEMRGLKVDMVRKSRWNKVQQSNVERMQNELSLMTATQGFNVNSYPQVRALLKALTGKDHSASDDKYLKKWMLKHPLYERVLGEILELRSEQKILSTYLAVGEEDKTFKGRLLYSSNPHGTDTGRDASKAHHFWCGQNIQNIPNGRWEIKNYIVADYGFEIYEADYSQAEARGVAYLSGDTNLLGAVNSPHDFHSLNASAFFGIPYEEIYQDAHDGYWDEKLDQWIEAAKAKTLNKAIRDLSKRVNHGANYNMGESVLLDTMGERNVRKAQALLGLSTKLGLLQVCGYLLQRYELTYPRVKTAHYSKVKRDVRSTNLLVGPTGWTRYCFGDPSSNKLDLNSYVAHVSQSLNAMILDEAARRIFAWLVESKLLNTIKLNAKIHDSLLFQVPVGRKDLAEEVQSRMQFDVPVTDCLGITRNMRVPAELSYCGHRWEMYQ